MAKNPPTEQDITFAMQVAKRPESADYLVKAFAKTMHKLGPAIENASKALQKNIETFRDYVVLQHKSRNYWAGEKGESDFKTLQENIAEQAASDLVHKNSSPIKVDMAISKASAIIRSISSKGKSLDTDTQKLVDQLIQAFFATNEVTVQGGVLYEANKDGEIKYTDGTAKKVDPAQVEKLVKDKEKGLQAYLESKNITVDAVKTHKFPEAPTEKVAPKTSQEAAPEKTRGPAAGI